VLSGLAPVAHFHNRPSGGQTKLGACRNEGLERLIAGEHVPHRRGELAGALDLRALRAALSAEGGSARKSRWSVFSPPGACQAR